MRSKERETKRKLAEQHAAEATQSRFLLPKIRFRLFQIAQVVVKYDRC